MLYEMLTGRLPFDPGHSSPLKMVMMHVSDTPPPLRSLVPELSPEIERVVLETLHKEFRERPDAGTLAHSFAAALGVALPPHQAVETSSE